MGTFSLWHWTIIILMLAVYFLAVTAQYYFINRPGPRSRDGMAYNCFQQFGEALHQVPSTAKIFTDLSENCPMIEYYAGRNLTRVSSPAEARKWMAAWHLHQAVWVNHDGFQFKSVQWISVP